LCLPICGEALKSLLILFPRLDRYIVNVHRAERIDKRARQAGISDQRDVEVDGGTSVYWPSEEGHPQALEMLHKKEIDMVVNIPKNLTAGELDNGTRSVVPPSTSTSR